MQDSLKQNHFDLFDLPVSFKLDTGLLGERYRAMQRSVHPDRFANAPERERLLSVQLAAQINEAYQILRSPLLRARYLLQLGGVSFNDERETTVDPVFLMEQMELRETLSEIKSSPEPLDALTKLLASIRNRIRQLESEFEQAFLAKNDASQQAAKQTVHKLQFMEKLRQEAEELEEDLLDQI